jgi:hypothetical protein
MDILSAFPEKPTKSEGLRLSRKPTNSLDFAGMGVFGPPFEKGGKGLHGFPDRATLGASGARSRPFAGEGFFQSQVPYAKSLMPTKRW